MVNGAVREFICLLLAEAGLCSDAVDDPQPLAKSRLQDLGVAASGPSRPHTHLAQQPLVDGEGRLHLCHICILP